MRKKPDHLQAVIDEVVGKISALQDLLRGLAKLRAERTEPVRPRAEKGNKTERQNEGATES